jgi:DNA-directed RNA polymerase subunit RPC12/RpoP
MASALTCPACQAPLQVGSTTAGQQVKCPRCQALITVPSGKLVEVAIPEDRPAPAAPPEDTKEAPSSAAPTYPCPKCGQPIAVTARPCQHCKAWLGEEHKEHEEYKPCPRCGAGGATRVAFTFWGSFYGPALFSHVRCPNCGYAYNGRTGRSNRIPAIIFVTIPAVLILAIIIELIVMIISRQ